MAHTFSHRCSPPLFSVHSAAEAGVILSHLAKHATYIKSTATFLLVQAQSSPDLQDSSIDERESDHIAAELAGAIAAVGALSAEVDSIKTQFEKASH